jgi:hypothetical protein
MDALFTRFVYARQSVHSKPAALPALYNGNRRPVLPEKSCNPVQTFNDARSGH